MRQPVNLAAVGRSHSLYAKVGDVLRSRILSEEWAPGARLPSEADLCEELGVSSITMRRAMADLVADGLLTRWQGKGTFVSTNRAIVQGPPGLTSFTDDLVSRGWKPSARVLDMRVHTAGSHIGPKLGIPDGALAISLSRVRIADDVAIAIQTTHVPAVLFPGLDKLDFTHRSLYQVMENDYGTRPVRSTDTYIASKLSAKEAQMLEARTGSPALRSERVSTDSTGRTLEFVESVIRGDHYTIVLNLSVSRSAGT